VRRQLADADIVLVDDAAPALQDWLSRNDAALVLVRPDRYVLGFGRDQADLPALLGAHVSAPCPVS
jgi:hypothetical protein